MVKDLCAVVYLITHSDSLVLEHAQMAPIDTDGIGYQEGQYQPHWTNTCMESKNGFREQQNLEYL